MRKHRTLTRGEESLTRYVFGNSINVGHVQVTRRSTDLQKDTAWAPFGAITFSKSRYRENFVAGDDMFKPEVYDDAHWFLHEMVHVWQHSQGMSLPLLAIKARLGGGDAYAYDLHGVAAGAAKDLLDFNIEQQGDIVADYFAHKLWTMRLTYSAVAYEKVLANFLADPTYARSKKGLWKFRAAFRGVAA